MSSLQAVRRCTHVIPKADAAQIDDEHEGTATAHTEEAEEATAG